MQRGLDRIAWMLEHTLSVHGEATVAPLLSEKLAIGGKYANVARLPENHPLSHFNGPAYLCSLPGVDNERDFFVVRYHADEGSGVTAVLCNESSGHLTNMSQPSSVNAIWGDTHVIPPIAWTLLNNRTSVVAATTQWNSLVADIHRYPHLEAAWPSGPFEELNRKYLDSYISTRLTELDGKIASHREQIGQLDKDIASLLDREDQRHLQLHADLVEMKAELKGTLPAYESQKNRFLRFQESLHGPASQWLPPHAVDLHIEPPAAGTCYYVTVQKRSA